MTIDCSMLETIIHSIPLVMECDRVRSGALRLSTPFTYPNGSNVDVFLESKNDLWDSFVLSDCGQTWLYLHDAQVKIDSTERKKQLLKDICEDLGITLRAGRLQVEISGDEISNISKSIFRLSQACVRISDFASHHRLRSTNPFRDDVEEFFDASGLSYEPDREISGPYGRKVKLDFEVVSKSSISFVLILSALNETSAHLSANEIFIKWHDVNDTRQWNTRKFVTVYNSASQAIRESDLQRLAEYSDVVSYPQQGELLSSILRTPAMPLPNKRHQI